MLSLENFTLFTKWVSIMPNKIISQFRNIYISNISDVHEFNIFKAILPQSELMLNNLLFDTTFITRSTYEFDLIIFADVDENINDQLLSDMKSNILTSKGEIWILCDDKKVDNQRTNEYILNILNKTNLRNSIIKFHDNMNMIIIR